MSIEQNDCKEFTVIKNMRSLASGPCGGGPACGGSACQGACQGACRGCRTEIMSVEPKGSLVGKVGIAELPVRGLR